MKKNEIISKLKKISGVELKDLGGDIIVIYTGRSKKVTDLCFDLEHNCSDVRYSLDLGSSSEGRSYFHKY